jgi:hypothetical protein
MGMREKLYHIVIGRMMQFLERGNNLSNGHALILRASVRVSLRYRNTYSSGILYKGRTSLILTVRIVLIKELISRHPLLGHT